MYFLQKKGWLGVAQNARWGTGKKRFVQELYEQAQKEKVNFFKDKLQYLFYEALAKERDNVNSYYKRFDCRIPFLNGGLFEADYNWQDANITIPENLFRNEEKNKSGDVGTGILDVFDRYNFTIKEDEPLDKEVAVDPEMLGKVFENMLDITERKIKGAFYTPREIVHYMCQESLIHYLDNALNSGTSSYQELGSDQTKLFSGSTNKNGNLKIELEHTDNIRLLKKDIETFIREGHFALENDERVANKGETKTYQYQLPESIRKNANLIDKNLSSIKICDPAIGSGAFPVGLLHELVNALLVLKPHLTYDYLTEKLKGFGFTHRESVSDSRYIYRLKRHIIQESIYGVDIDSSAIDIARLRLWLSLVVDEDDLDPIETLPNLDYKIVCGNSLIGFPEGWNSPAFQKIENLKKEFYNETDESRKKELKATIESEIQDRLRTSKRVFGYQVDFDFKLFFSEVWREKGGFDIVIGNPPYDVYEGKKNDEIPTIKKIDIYDIAKSGKLNAYKLFLAKSIKILNDGGIFNQIFQNSFLGDNSAKLLRKHFLTEQKIIRIDSFPERDDLNKRVFFSAKMSVCILFSQNKKMVEYDFPLFVWSERWMENSYSSLFSNKELMTFDKESYVIPSVSQEEKIF
ncbi:MAG: N-6 DNA methylase [Saprospiraceae bacterium]|nr:N-6 DNA methylase [Saprospiraceae bacterium]